MIFIYAYYYLSVQLIANKHISVLFSWKSAVIAPLQTVVVMSMILTTTVQYLNFLSGTNSRICG